MSQSVYLGARTLRLADGTPRLRRHIAAKMLPNTAKSFASLLIAVVLFWTPSQISAQVVHGQVVDSTSGMPVAKGFVVLLDPRGSEVVRSLSSADGRFTLRAPAPGSYQLRSERIGFRASESEFLTLAEGETVDFTLQVAQLPVRLDAVVVAGSGSCNVNPAEGGNTILIWEEIRKALAATVWGDEQELFHYRQYTYQRALNHRRNRKIDETLTTKSGVADPPFRSVPAEQLARDGYIAEREDGTWYYLPDAQTLLHSDFLSTHCFHVVRDEDERPGQVGLAFEPTSDRTLPDVEGTLWLDEESSELSELEARHTRIPYDVRDSRIGGNVRFLMLPSGAWIVREWQIRVPRIDVTENPRYARGHRGEVVGFTDTGGEVFEVTTRDGTPVYEAQAANVAGSVFDSTSAGPLKGALILVVGTDFRTITDSGGLFELALPLDGQYSLTLDHPRLDSVAAENQTVTVDIERGRKTETAFSVPHVSSAMSRICGGSVPSADSRMIFGIVRRHGTAEPARGASVSAFWQTFRIGSVGRGGRTETSPFGQMFERPALDVSVRNMGEQVTTDEMGFYAICGVPVGRPVRLSADKDGATSREGSVMFEEYRGRLIQFGWDRAPGGAWDHVYESPHPAWKLDLFVGDPNRVVVEQASPVLYGTVTDSVSGEPLADVAVVVNGIDRTVTGADGTYRVDIEWVESGNRVEFRRLGYAPGIVLVQNEGTEREVLMNFSLQRMP